MNLIPSRWIVVFGMLGPGTGLAQDAPPDVVGFLRADGIALPLYEFTQNQWTHVGGADGRTGLEHPIWESIETYFGRTQEGAALSLAAGAPVPTWAGDYEPAYGQETNFETTGSRWQHAHVGYIATDSAGHAQFGARPEGFPEAQLQFLFDSLAPIPDSVSSRLFENRSWGASIDDEEWVFFRATRFALVGPYDPCLSVQGWWDPESDPRSAFVTHVGRHDCESTFVPWALLRRGSDTYALTTRTGWADWYAEIWLSLRDGSWSRQATTCGHCN